MMTTPPKISLGSWAFTYGPYEKNPISFHDTAIRLSEVGYHGVEIGGFEPHVTLAKYPDSTSRRKLRRFLDDLGLGVSGYAADFGTLDPTKKNNKEAYLELFKRYIGVCADLGAPLIRVDCVATPGSITDAATYRSAMLQLAETWNEAAGIAEPAHVAVVWEFEPAFVFNKPSEVVALVETVAHANFNVLFDTSHAYMCGVVGARQFGDKETLPGGVAEFLHLLDGKIGHVHLIDSDGTLYEQETSTHAPFGQGVVDFQSLAPRLLALPDISWWCVDLCFWPDAWDLVGSCLQFMQDLQETEQ